MKFKMTSFFHRSSANAIDFNVFVWHNLADVIKDKDGNTLYWPNRAGRFWRVKSWWWRLLARLGKRAPDTRPTVDPELLIGTKGKPPTE